MNGRRASIFTPQQVPGVISQCCKRTECIKAQEACEDLVLSVLFIERCITERCNVLSDIQRTQDFSTRATVVLQLLMLCLSGEERPCDIAKEQRELYKLLFFLLFPSCSFSVVPKRVLDFDAGSSDASKDGIS